MGHAAYQAYRAGETGSQPCFAERIALQEKIEALQKEYEQLSSPSDASFFQKTKAKTQQLVVAGKNKIEELRIGSQETHIGKSLLDTGTEQTVACTTTAALLDTVCQQRAVISRLRSDLDAAGSALDLKSQEFCRTLGISCIENAGTFDAEIRVCKSHIGQAQKELTALEHGIPDRLAANPGKLGTPLAGLLGDLQQANEQMALSRQKGGARAAIESAGVAALDRGRQLARTAVDAAKSPQSREAAARMGARWRKLERRHKVAVGVIAGGAIVVAIIIGLFGRGGGDRVTPMETQQVANEAAGKPAVEGNPADVKQAASTSKQDVPQVSDDQVQGTTPPEIQPANARTPPLPTGNSSSSALEVHKTATEAAGEPAAERIPADAKQGMPPAKEELARAPVTNEPVIDGKSLSEWTKALNDSNSARRVEAIKAIARMGVMARAVVGNLEKVLNAKEESPEVKQQAAIALGEIGGKAAIRVLLGLAEELAPHGRYHPWFTLSIDNCVSKTGKDAIPLLSEALTEARNDSSSFFRQMVIRVMGNIGPEALEGLRKELDNPDLVVRSTALSFLTKMGADAVAPVVQYALKAHDGRIVMAQKLAEPAFR